MFWKRYGYGYGQQPYLDLSCYVIWHDESRAFDTTKIDDAYKILSSSN